MQDLSAFRTGFDALKQLYLRRIPASEALLAPVFGLPNLQTLALEKTVLKQLPSALQQLSQLQTLYLDANQLTSIPHFLLELPQLKNLTFRNNQVQEFPPFLGKHPQQPTIAWRDNPLGEPPSALATLPTTMTLSDFKGPQLRQYNNFIDRVRGLLLSPSALELLFLIKNGHPLPTQQFERAHFLAALQYPDKNVQTLVIDRLLEYEQDRFMVHPLTPKSALAVVGIRGLVPLWAPAFASTRSIIFKF